MSGEEFFEGRSEEHSDEDPLLVVDVEGFEGPLDLLLDLARRQKVDLHEISVLALAEQYLAFVETARSMRLELAADYLVMAAWLAYLKSRLLLPEPPKPEGPSAAELATALASRLRRLEAMREAAKRLADRPQLGREVFARVRRDEPAPSGEATFTASLYDLLAAYGRQRQRAIRTHVTVARRPVWGLVEARAALNRLLGEAGDWISLDAYLLRYVLGPEMRATVLASSLAATLEMVREGRVRLHQDAPFAPLMVRRAEPAGAPA
jgi:segregation and condensation protein A